MLFNERRVKAMALLEHMILEWAETNIISEALQRRDFIEMELKESILRSIIKQKIAFFKPHSPTAHDDSAVKSQLEMDSLCLSMVVKAKSQEYELHQNEKENLVS